MLDEKTKALIAVGASITANCQSCLDTRTGKATELGIPDADILAAIEVGKMVRTGAAGKMDVYVKNRAGAPQPVTAGGGCCS
ncbi:MAG: carboxymuconolactone decarboxylase family protein [Desulfobulbus sp.]|nr:carboxymuconolactone decarboxylase family protein [Desulfobulbus sp.]